MDFSGAGAFRAYKNFCDKKYTVPKTTSTTHLQQIVFHAMFGTHVEDFGILKFMTAQGTWHKRHEISPKLISEELKHKDRGPTDKQVFVAICVAQKLVCNT